jgi:hypothetical protein
MPGLPGDLPGLVVDNALVTDKQQALPFFAGFSR